MRTSATTSPRLCVVQYGDYRAALLAQQRGEPETYRAQHYSLDAVRSAMAGGQTLVVCLDCEPYDFRAPGIRVAADRFAPVRQGLGYILQAFVSARRILRLLEEFDPTHCVIRTPGFPFVQVCRWALGRGVHVLPLFADYFPAGSLRERLRLRPLVGLLNDRRVPLVANHNAPACLSMATAGVAPEKIVAYDWPPQRHPDQSPPKPPPLDGAEIRICYAGQISRAKGVGDLIEACRVLRDRLPLRLDLFGEGPERPELERQARSAGLQDICAFHGVTANPLVLRAMREATLVVVPSRHEYPEGIPCVIYEAFETRTPVIASDHPSFRGKLHSGRGCLVFSAADPGDLARRIEEAVSNASAYAALSETTALAWQDIQCPVTFGELLRDWLAQAHAPEALATLRHAMRPGRTT